MTGGEAVFPPLCAGRLAVSFGPMCCVVMELFLHPGCVPFTVALGFLLFLCLYQIGSLVLGLGLPGAVEAPDLPDLPENGLSVCLDWLNLGRVPIIVALILFSWVFAALGLVVQNMLNGALGFMLPVWIAVPAAGAVSLVLMHWLIPPIAAILPKDDKRHRRRLCRPHRGHHHRRGDRRATGGGAGTGPFRAGSLPPSDSGPQRGEPLRRGGGSHCGETRAPPHRHP